jgi:YD repeat-containing protein
MSGLGHKTQYSFSDNYSSGTAPGNTNAYLTQIKNPLGYTSNIAYAYIDGQMTSDTDPNNNTTTYQYADSLRRLTQINYPDDGETTISYNDSVPSITRSIYQTPNPSKTSVAIMDGMGHVIQTQTSEAAGSDVVSTTYDGQGRVYTGTNPFVSSLPPSSTLVSTSSGTPLTTYYYDVLGRPVETLEQDGSTLQWCYDGVASTPAVYCSSHLGSVTGAWVDSTDENGNHWQRTSDSYGRLTEVMEPNGSAQPSSMETDYAYDGNDNLLSAIQGGNGSTSVSRSFIYDSLSRLLTATNPESGTTTYSYDANGNIISKTDARGYVTGYSYDALNRVTGKSSIWFPSSCYQYDVSSVPGAGGNLIGRLTNEWTQSWTVPSCYDAPGSSEPPSGGYVTLRSLSYDPMGRITQEQECTPSNCASTPYTPYTLSYSYDLAGNLTSQTSPTPSGATSPLTLSYAYDGASRLQALTSGWANTTTHPSCLFAAQRAVSPTTATCAQTTTTPYMAFGGLWNAFYGSGPSITALTQNRTYDNRLRVIGETDTGSQYTGGTTGAAKITITGAEQESIVPYIQDQQLDYGVWQNVSSLTVNLGDTVNFGPQPLNGTWSWSGPNGYTANTRAINNIPLTAGINTYVATYTSPTGAVSSQPFILTVNPGTAIVPLIQDYSQEGGSWQEVSNLTVNYSDTVNFGPQPENGTWSWTGPNGFTANTRALNNIPLPLPTNVYTATYTNSGVGQSTLAFTLTVNSTPIIPYLQVNYGAWQNVANVAVNYSDTVNFGPQPASVGSWSWTGPNGFTSNSRALNGIALPSGTNVYTATYTNPSGVTSTQAFIITVNSTPIIPYLQVNYGAWQNVANVAVNYSDTVNFGPQPASVGSWSWTGPNGFTANTRALYGIPLSTGTNTYTATYTNPSGVTSTQAFTITVN